MNKHNFSGKIPLNLKHNFMVYKIINEKGEIFTNENLPLLEWAKENNYSYTSLDKLRKGNLDIQLPYKNWKLKKLYLKRKHFQRDDSYLYILFDLTKPGNYEYNGYKFNYEPFYVGSGTYNRIFDYAKENMINKSLFSEKYNLIRTLYETYKLEDFVYIFKVSKSKEEIDILEKEFIHIVGRKINDTGPLLNTLDGDIFSNNEISKKYNESRNTPEFLGYLSSMVKEKQWSGEKGDVRRKEHSKKFKEINPSRKHYFLRCKDGNFYIFGSLRQWCKDNNYSLNILRTYENTGIIVKKFEKDNSFLLPQKAKLLGADFFSFTQKEFEELDSSKKEELFKEFNIKELDVN